MASSTREPEQVGAAWSLHVTPVLRSWRSLQREMLLMLRRTAPTSSFSVQPACASAAANKPSETAATPARITRTYEFMLNPGARRKIPALSRGTQEKSYRPPSSRVEQPSRNAVFGAGAVTRRGENRRLDGSIFRAPRAFLRAL